MKTKKNGTQTKPEDKVSQYKRLNPKNYTVVPVEEYLDTSGKTKAHWDNLIDVFFYLNEAGVNLSVHPEKTRISRNGIRKWTNYHFPFCTASKIIKMKNGKFALLSYFANDTDLPADDIEEVEILYDKYDQRYFGDFIMPLLKRRDEWILEKIYYAFLYELYFENPIYGAMHYKWKKIFKEKAKAMKLQKYEECAQLRDEEKEVEESIKTFLLHEIKQSERKDLNREDFMKYWGVFVMNFPE